MQVSDGLPTVFAMINDQPVAGLIQPLGGSDLDRSRQHGAQDVRIGAVRVGDGGNVAPWYDQYVRRRLRVEITESDGVPILAHSGRRDTAGCNGTEDTIRHQCPPRTRLC